MNFFGIKLRALTDRVFVDGGYEFPVRDVVYRDSTGNRLLHIRRIVCGYNAGGYYNARVSLTIGRIEVDLATFNSSSENGSIQSSMDVIIPLRTDFTFTVRGSNTVVSIIGFYKANPLAVIPSVPRGRIYDIETSSTPKGESVDGKDGKGSITKVE